MALLAMLSDFTDAPILEPHCAHHLFETLKNIIDGSLTFFLSLKNQEWQNASINWLDAPVWMVEKLLTSWYLTTSQNYYADSSQNSRVVDVLT